MMRKSQTSVIPVMLVYVLARNFPDAYTLCSFWDWWPPSKVIPTRSSHLTSVHTLSYIIYILLNTMALSRNVLLLVLATLSTSAAFAPSMIVSSIGIFLKSCLLCDKVRNQLVTTERVHTAGRSRLCTRFVCTTRLLPFKLSVSRMIGHVGKHASVYASVSFSQMWYVPSLA